MQYDGKCQWKILFLDQYATWFRCIALEYLEIELHVRQINANETNTTRQSAYIVNPKGSPYAVIQIYPSQIKRDIMGILTLYFPRTWRQLLALHKIDIDQWPLLLTWFNFDPSMDK